MFTEFSKPAKTDWIRQALKELDGRPLESIYWQFNEDLSIAPLFTEEDLPKNLQALSRPAPGNNWEIGEVFLLEDLETGNRDVLEGLAGGTEALLFQFRHQPGVEELEKLLKGIELGYISTHFDLGFPGKDPVACYETFTQVLARRGQSGHGIRGSIDFDPLLDWSDPPLDQAAALIRKASREEPGIRVLQVNGRLYHTGQAGMPTELALIAAKGLEYLSQLTDRGLGPDVVNASMQFSIAVSPSYFAEIAKFRALRLVWESILNAYGLEDAAMPPVIAHFSLESQSVDPFHNMIQAATLAMSAVLGGADRLFIAPANPAAPGPPSAFHRRIARNVHHILKMESFLDRVADPAAGSYYIEKLTEVLAESAWEELQGMG